MDVKDVAGFGSAIEKLIEVIARGVGAWSHGWLRKRDARDDIEVRKIQLQGEQELKALAEANEKPANDGVAIEHARRETLEERTDRRVSYQEAKRQLNVENTVLLASGELEGVDPSTVSGKPVDDDWIARFFFSAQDVSNEDMQKIWSKLLAGEIVRPGAVSLRCMELLRNLTVEEAKLFTRIASFAGEDGSLVSLLGLHQDSDWAFWELLTLHDAGLMQVTGMSMGIENQGSPEAFRGLYEFRDMDLIFEQDKPVQYPIRMDAYRLTAPGVELAQVLKIATDKDFAERMKNHFVGRGFTARFAPKMLAAEKS